MSREHELRVVHFPLIGREVQVRLYRYHMIEPKCFSVVPQTFVETSHRRRPRSTVCKTFTIYGTNYQTLADICRVNRAMSTNFLLNSSRARGLRPLRTPLNWVTNASFDGRFAYLGNKSTVVAATR